MTTYVFAWSEVSNAAGIPQTSADSPERQRAIALYDQKKFDEAGELLKAVVKKDKNDHLAWYYLGFTFIHAKKHKDATKALETAVKISPTFAAGHSGLGYSFLFRGKWKEALRAAEAALKIDPKLADAYYVLSVGHLRTDNHDAAVKNAEAAIDLNPNFGPAYLVKSQALISFFGDVPVAVAGDPPETRRQRFSEAADALQKFLDLNPDTTDKATWLDQLESLRFYGRPRDPNKERTIFPGRDVTVKARVLSKPEPAYTEEARSAGISGTVVLRGVFAEDGTIKHLLVLKALPGGLTEASLRAARKIKFVPATINGRKVSTYIQLEYNFNVF